MYQVFQDHSKERADRLIEQSRNLIEFLEDVDAIKVLYSGEIINKAIYRYKEYWLPMLAHHFNDCKSIYPPIDVAWVWHCHMLCPTKYANDCMSLFGRLLPHEHLSRDERLTRQEATKKLWKSECFASFNYQSENSISDSETFLRGGPSKISYNLKEASLRQKEFYYQASLPHYKEREYLEIAVANYFKFLQLKALRKQLFIVPTYAIDVVWHAHQCDPIHYEIECNAALGYLLPHDDEVNDRSTGSKLNTSYDETVANWLMLYKEDYFCAGGMYRGEPKSKFYSPEGLKSEEKFQFAKNTYRKINGNNELQLTKMCVDKVFGSSKGALEVKICQPFGTKNELSGEISIGKPMKVRANKAEVIFGETDKTLTVDIGYTFKDSILAKMKNLLKRENTYKEKGGSIAVAIHQPTKLVEITTDTQQIDDKYGNRFSLTSEWRLCHMPNSFIFLRLQNNAFDEIRITQNLSQFPVFDFQELSYGDDDALIARHTLYLAQPNSNIHQACLTVEVLHVISTQWSSIRITDGVKTLASAHMINNSQLPTPEQVNKPNVPSLGKNERAMLVRNAAGDFAVVKGSKRKDVALQYYLLHNETVKYVKADKDRVQLIDEQLDLRLDNKSGEFTIGFNEGHVDELRIESMLAVVFSMSLLHVQLLPKIIDSKRKTFYEKETEGKIFLSAMGYNELMNHSKFKELFEKAKISNVSQNNSSSGYYNNDYLFFTGVMYTSYAAAGCGGSHSDAYCDSGYAVACDAGGSCGGGACGSSGGACGGGGAGCGGGGAGCGGGGAGCGGGGCGGGGCGGGGCGGG